MADPIPFSEIKYRRIGVGRIHVGLFVRVLSVAAVFLFTPTTLSASNLILDPGEGGTLVPKPFKGGHGFRYEFAEQTGAFIIENLDRSGNIQSRTTLDFDGTLLGEPSWIMEIGAASGLISLNELFGNAPIPLGLGSGGAVQSRHFHGSSSDVWFAGSTTIVSSGGEGWILFASGASLHGADIPPSPTDPTAFVAFTNQTGGRVDIHSLVPEPSTLVASLIASVALLGTHRRRKTGHSRLIKQNDVLRFPPPLIRKG